MWARWLVLQSRQHRMAISIRFRISACFISTRVSLISQFRKVFFFFLNRKTECLTFLKIISKVLSKRCKVNWLVLACRLQTFPPNFTFLPASYKKKTPFLLLLFLFSIFVFFTTNHDVAVACRRITMATRASWRRRHGSTTVHTMESARSSTCSIRVLHQRARHLRRSTSSRSTSTTTCQAAGLPVYQSIHVVLYLIYY